MHTALIILASTAAILVLGWAIYNPFWWVTELPTVSERTRMDWLGNGLGFCVFIAFVSFLLWAVWSGISDMVKTAKDDKKPIATSPPVVYVPRHSSQPRERVVKTGPDAVDIALGVGAGIVGADIITDFLDGE